MDGNDDPVKEYLNAIDRAMLLPVVRRVLDSETVEIDDGWHAQPITEGSAVGTVVRLTGTGRDQAKPVSWSLILKLTPAPAGESSRHIETSDDPTAAMYWHRERLLYESGLFSTLPEGLTVPQCYRIDDRPNGCWLWLEAIEDPLHRDWPLAHYAIAARHIGRFNGQYLTGRELPDWPWLTSPCRRMREIEQRIESNDLWSRLPKLCTENVLVRRGWPDGLLEGYHRIWQEREHYFQALERLPRTLNHADTGNRNLFLRSRNGQHETVAIDWSFTGFGAVGEDLMPLVLSSVVWFGVHPSQYDELDQLAFDGYLQGLHDAGWHGDPKAVRLGYLALASLRFGFQLAGLALTEADRQKYEILLGRPLEDIIDNMAAVRRIIVACADEARALMDNHILPNRGYSI